MKNLFTLFLVAISLQLFAQSGTVRGKAIDDETGEAIMFANVFINELSNGTTTDLDGAYSFDLAPGTYTITFSYLGYSDLPISELVINAGKVTLLDVRMKEETELLDEVVVTAKQMRNTETALATIKQRSVNLIDGVSSSSIKRTGDGNAGEALRRVTGVSVEGGKHVVVRGLGDRYTKTILNSVEIPGLDPDRNSVQMDLFPTNLIDNLIVYKTFSPDLPGDFSGGAVNIITKDFPEKFTFSASAGVSYNPSMSFKKDFLGYKGSSTDWLGFDNGYRKLPFSKFQDFPDVSKNDPRLTSLTNAFNKELAAKTMPNDLNKSLSISVGNQKNFGSHTLGLFAGVNYVENFNHYENAIFNEYYRDANDNSYFQSRKSFGKLSETVNQWSALGGLSYKYKNHKLSLQALHVQSGEQKAGIFTQEDLVFNNSLIVRDNLEYYQRAITNIGLTGNHAFAKGKYELDWKLSPSLVNVDEPDIKTTGFDNFDGQPLIRPAVGAEVSRIYRYLDEISYNGRVDFVYNFKVKGLDSKLKTGLYATFKERDFEIYNYLFQPRNQTTLGINGDPDKILLDQNVWSQENPNGVYIIGNYEPANTFNARQQVMAGYVMNELPLSKKVKLTYGARVEKADNFYTGQNNQGDIKLKNEKILDKLNVLPSANLLVNLTENLNLRASANRTVARPSFKENSVAQIQDRITGRTFLGNINLKQSSINNADIRLERFLGGGQLISASVFFKQFIDPIQLVVFDPATPTNYQPKNLDDTNVFGFEIEVNKSLDFVTASLSHFNVGMNYTYVKSGLPLVGLSPQIFNANISYIDREKGWEGSISYNVQARRLSIVGAGRIEDVYENPLPALNFRLAKQFGADKQYGISIGGENMLNSKKWRTYNTKDGSEAIFDSFNLGRQFNLTLSYKI